MAAGLSLQVSSVSSLSTTSFRLRTKPRTSLSTLYFSSTSSRLSFHAASWSHRGDERRRPPLFSFVASALRKLSDAELVPVPPETEEVSGSGEFPPGPGVFGVYDKVRELQFIGITRNIAASVAFHRKSVPELCCFVKVELIEEPEASQATLTNAWKSWMEEHLAETGKVPPGNETNNNTWVRRPPQKPDIRLTPGLHVKLTVPIEEIVDRLVKETEVVAFIKGSRIAPSCGFSQRVVNILQAQKVDFECVDVLDEEHNHGLREALKTYSNWPTFPQVFVKGQFVGGCDIISDMAEKGELSLLFQK